MIVDTDNRFQVAQQEAIRPSMRRPMGGNGSEALEFLDTERQNAAKGISDEQREDAAKAVGMGTTFGVMKGINEKPSEMYGKDILRRVNDSDVSVPDSAKRVIREFGDGGAVRRFGRPFVGAGLATYAGSRLTNNLLGEEKIYERDTPSQLGQVPSSVKQAFAKESAKGDPVIMDDPKKRYPIMAGGLLALPASGIAASYGGDAGESVGKSVGRGVSGEKTLLDIDEDLASLEAATNQDKMDELLDQRNRKMEGGRVFKSPETIKRLGRSGRVLGGLGAAGLVGGGIAYGTDKLLEQEDPLRKTSSLTKESAGKWLDDMFSYFGKGSDDVNLPDAEDAINEFGRRQDAGDVDLESLSPEEMDSQINELKRQMQLEEAGEAVRDDTGFQMKRTWDDFKTEAGKYAPDLGVNGTMKALGGAGIAGGAGFLGNVGYEASQPDVQLTPGQRRANRTTKNVMHPAGPLRGAGSPQRRPQRMRGRQKQASVSASEKTAAPGEGSEAGQAMGVAGGLGALGAGTYAGGEYGDDVIRQGQILDREGFRRLHEFTNLRPKDRSAQNFMREYMRRGSRVTGENLVDLPFGLGKLTGADALEGVRDSVPDTIEENVLGRWSNLFQGGEIPDDVRSRHYRSFAEGPAQALPQIFGDQLADPNNKAMRDAYGTFQRDIATSRNNALKATLDGEGGFDQRAFKENLGGEFQSRLNIPEEDARQYAKTVEDRMYKSDPTSYQRYFQNAIENDDLQSANRDQVNIIDNLYGGEDASPGGDGTGQKGFQAMQQNLVDKAQSHGFRGVESMDDIKGMSRDGQMKLLNAEGSTEDVFQQYGELKAHDSFRLKPRTYRASATNPAQDAMNTIERSAQNFAEETAPKMKSLGKGIVGAAPLAGAAYFGAQKMDDFSMDKESAEVPDPTSGREEESSITGAFGADEAALHRGWSMELDPKNPYEMGIYSGKSDETNLGVAATTGTGAAATSGALIGAGVRGTTGQPTYTAPWRFAKNFPQISDEVSQMAEDTRSYVSESGVGEGAKELGAGLSKGERFGDVLKNVADKVNFRKVVPNAALGALGGAGLAVGSDMAANAASYGAGHTVSGGVDTPNIKEPLNSAKERLTKSSSAVSKRTEKEADEMDLGNSLGAGGLAAGAGSLYQSGKAVNKVKENKELVEKANKLEQEVDSVDPEKAQQIAESENFKGKVTTPGPFAALGGGQDRSAFGVTEDAQLSPGKITPRSEELRIIMNEYDRPTFLHELGHFKSFEDNHIGQGLEGHMNKVTDETPKDAGIINDFLGRTSESPLVEEERRAWRNAKDLKQRHMGEGFTPTENSLKETKLQTYLGQDEALRFGRNSNRLMLLGAGLGLAGMGVNTYNEAANEKTGSTYGTEKEAARKLEDLERRGDKVKYQGRWMPVDEPVESWRPGKKRAVLATKDESGDKKVKLVHYGASDFDHNYSEDAKSNYLSRAKGITDGDGNPTKDDPHSANHWSIKDLWPEDDDPDGSAKLDLKNLGDEKTGNFIRASA